MKQKFHQNNYDEFWFWRDASGREVDLIRQDDFMFNTIEIKSTSTIMHNLFKGLEYFESLAKDLVKSKTLVYAGLKIKSEQFQMWFLGMKLNNYICK